MKHHRFKSIEEFTEEVDNGYDMEFEYKGRKYGVCRAQATFSFAVYEWDKAETTEKIYSSGKEMIEDYEIQGEKLKDIILKVEKGFY